MWFFFTHRIHSLIQGYPLGFRAFFAQAFFLVCFVFLVVASEERPLGIDFRCEDAGDAGNRSGAGDFRDINGNKGQVYVSHFSRSS